MNNIYIFLKNVWTDLNNCNKESHLFIAFLFLIITIAFPLGVNNISLIVFTLIFLFNYKKIKFNKNYHLLLPITMFIWMSLSYFWSIDHERTLKAIPKEISLLIIPLVFLFTKPLHRKLKVKILKYYSFTIFLLALIFISRAFLRYFLTGDTRSFFYHGEYEEDFGLVPKLLNAIHVSVYVAIAFFYFFTKEIKNRVDYLIIGFLLIFILLLSSKNIIVVVLLLTLIFVFFYSKIANKMRLRNALIIIFIIGVTFSFSRIKERFLIEFQSNTDRGLSHNITSINTKGVEFVSIYEAWNNEKFSHGDYFPGTAFRVYQTRMFLEFLDEEDIFWKGFGLNASLNKLLEKEKKYNLYPGYGTFNFHNQYVQNFAELGIVGFLILISILFLSLKTAIQRKDFMHIVFTILMISLFLTESFLWRQRGVVFFIAFYCLFMSQKKEKLKEIK